MTKHNTSSTSTDMSVSFWLTCFRHYNHKQLAEITCTWIAYYETNPDVHLTHNRRHVLHMYVRTRTLMRPCPVLSCTINVKRPWNPSSTIHGQARRRLLCILDIPLHRQRVFRASTPLVNQCNLYVRSSKVQSICISLRVSGNRVCQIMCLVGSWPEILNIIYEY